MNRQKVGKCKCITPELMMASCSQSKNSSYSVVKFYNSIPDYEELHHLSETEFYSRLGTLRETYSRLKYGSDSARSSQASKSSDESVETVRKAHINSKRTSPITKDAEAEKENRESNIVLDTLDKERELNAVGSGGSPNRRAMSASPARRSSLKSSSKAQFGPKCKSLSRYEKSFNDLEPNAKGKKKRAGYIPLTSRVPIYDQILEDQKQRSEIRKLESAIELQSKIKPFHFSTKNRSRCSSVSASQGDFQGKKEKHLKTCSASKKVNSSYFASKKWEEDYFRRINRMIRSEELLKLSTPSPMEKKETPRPKSTGSCKFCVRKKNRRKKISKQKDALKEKTFLSQSVIGDTADNKTNTPESGDDLLAGALPIYPVARPNLAAKLRAEVARKRTQKGSECNLPKQATQFDWGVRKTPAWKSLAYNETNDEDISFRLATRRAELSMRNREHALNMELMRERVRAAPLLLEGNTFWSHRIGKASHSCGKESHSSIGKSEKKRVKSAGSIQFEPKFIKKPSKSANCSNLQKNNDSDDLESEDRAYL